MTAVNAILQLQLRIKTAICSTTQKKLNYIWRSLDYQFYVFIQELRDSVEHL